MYKPAFPLLLLSLALSGCNSSPSTRTVSAASQADIASSRPEIELIPLPTKSRYLAVRSLSAWENPYLTVQANMLTLHTLRADANTSDIGLGTMMRPVGARREDLTIRVADLPASLDAIPRNAWPYGRVVAMEEAHETPASARPEVRRNMEAAFKTLADLGVIAYEWNENANAH